MSVLCFDLQYSIAAILDKNAELLSDTVQCPVDLIKKKIKISLNQQKVLFCSKKKIFDEEQGLHRNNTRSSLNLE